MTDALIIFCTVPHDEEAERIARVLVGERLAACVNILPGVRSVYRWEGEVEQAAELLLLIKTTAERLPDLRERLLQLHSYETPELLAVGVEEGLKAYLTWLRQSV